MSFDGFTSVGSDHIDAVKYDSMEQQLAIRFQNGYVYHAHGVLPEDYQAFMDAPSKGTHFHSVIKPNFHIERVK